MKMYRAKKVAEILAMKEGTIMKFLREGRIKGIKLGTRWRITEDEIKRILGLQENRQQGTGEGPQKDQSRAL